MTTPLALVTGASRGIGRAVARQFAALGYDLVLVARGGAGLESVAVELGASGVDVRTIGVDLADADAVEAAVAALGIDRLDVLVNNAAVMSSGVLASTTTAEFADAFAVNVTAPATLVRLLTPALVAARGSVVMINSGAGRVPFADKPVYVASKFALTGLTDSIRLDLAPQGVRVITVAPGPTNTRLGGRSAAEDGATPVPGKLQPEEVADSVVHAVRHRGVLEFVSVRPPLD